MVCTHSPVNSPVKMLLMSSTGRYSRMLTVTNTHWLDDAAFARLAGEICHA